MKNIQLHIVGDLTFTSNLLDFAFRHEMKKSQVLHKAISALRWTMEKESFSSAKYRRDSRPVLECEIHHFFTVTEEESYFLEHCAKVNGYFSKSDFVRDILLLYIVNSDIMTEEVYVQRLESDKVHFEKAEYKISSVCPIRLRRFEYYIRSFLPDIRDYYSRLKSVYI